MSAAPESERRCGCCREWLDIQVFYKDPVNQTGLSSWCADCRETHRAKCGRPFVQESRLVTFDASAEEAEEDGDEQECLHDKTMRSCARCKGVYCDRCKAAVHPICPRAYERT